MISTILTQLFLLFIFLIISILLFYFSGNLFLNQHIKQFTHHLQLLLSFVTGITIFIVLAVILGLLHLRFFLLPLMFFLSIYSFSHHKQQLLTSLRQVFTDKIFLIILFLGIIVLGFINFPSGLHYQSGDLYWSSQGHDGLWHVTVMQSVAHNFPIKNPLLPSQLLKNYHYASDIFFGEFYRIFPLFNPFDLYFRFFPVLLTFLLGLSVFSFVEFNWDRISAYWAMVFTYFAGSFGYIYALTQGNFLFSGETTFWASQGHTILGNPPHTIGIIWLTTIYTVVSIYLKAKKQSIFYLKLIFFLGFGLTIVKVLSGVVLVGSLITAGLYYYLRYRNSQLLKLSLSLALSNFFLLKIISPTAESFLVFQPLWFPRTMMVTRLNDVDWELRRQHYLSLGTFKAWLRIIQLETDAILIFIIGNSGMRLIGLYSLIKSFLQKNKDKTLDLLLLSAGSGSVIFILFFVQKGITFNLIQFMQIYLHLLGIYAGVTLAGWLKKISSHKLTIATALIVMSFTIPTAIGSLFDFYGHGHHPLAKVSNGELEALHWIKNHTPANSLFLIKPFDKNAHYQYHQQPMPIYAWYSTPYVTAYTDRDVFFSAEEQLAITGYNIRSKIADGKKFFNASDIDWNINYLKDNHINYIYAHKNELDKPLDATHRYLSTVFSNDKAIVYEVK